MQSFTIILGYFLFYSISTGNCVIAYNTILTIPPFPVDGHNTVQFQMSNYIIGLYAYYNSYNYCIASLVRCQICIICIFCIDTELMQIIRQYTV